jgi:hypothetical protein
MSAWSGQSGGVRRAAAEAVRRAAAGSSASTDEDTSQAADPLAVHNRKQFPRFWHCLASWLAIIGSHGSRGSGVVHGRYGVERRLRALAVAIGSSVIFICGAGTAAATPSAEFGTSRDSPRTPSDFLCTGTWNHEVSTVNFQRAPAGTLQWGFWLTNNLKAQIGPVATVSMPLAYVNDRPIYPAYQPHTRESSYNFHASLNNYNFIAGGSGTIQTGDKVTLYWFIQGANPNVKANRYITCAVPAPGSH